MGMHTLPVADAFGVPTYYVTNIVQEDAGNGNVRITICCNRSSILIPQCELIMSASTAMLLSSQSATFAQDVFNTAQMLFKRPH